MNRSLYFIPLIEKAFQQSNPREALANAFREIDVLGQDPMYADGFAMFRLFMAEVAENWKHQSGLSNDEMNGIIDNITLHLYAETLSTESLEGTAETDKDTWPPGFLDLIKRRIMAFSPPMDTDHPPLELNIIRDGETIATFQLNPKEPHHRIGEVCPGNYTFELGSGRLLWEVELKTKDLVTTVAEAGKNLRLAADTSDRHDVEPSREMAVLDNELVFRIFPGLENGWIEVEVKEPQ